MCILAKFALADLQIGKLDSAMSAQEDLLRDIEKFIAKHRMPETVFGAKAMNDTALVAKLRKGRSVRLVTAERLRAFIRDYRPDGKPRPRYRPVQPAA